MASQPNIIMPRRSPQVRRAIENKIEELIELLDEIDGDIDLEDDELHGDELDLGEDNTLANPAPIYGRNQTGKILAWSNPKNMRRVRAQEI
jgi:hypothetical protein